MPIPKFNMEVNLGNLLSAATVLVMVTIFIVSIRAATEVEMTELRGEMKVYVAKLEQLNRDFAEYKLTSQSSNVELRQTLNRMDSTVNDMRVLIAGQRDREQRR